VRTILILLAALLPTLAAAQSTRVSDDYAIAALRAVVHAQTFGPLEADSPKLLEFLNEADVQATTDVEERSLETIERVLVGGWRVNHSGMQVQTCYAALKTALKRRDGATPEPCK